ncbi:Haem-NO-binding [Sphingomonas guangdongensis]|uniref:Haem-NO-binding n=1 Tax=Sphingomonas guangdongensis TaxID=1141890 RepID=A0A285R3G9_9SPHN|nr:heme NO-binding domain-containing protein [Sphingomonas guangdongensis]SOB88308.1 Haem-NO-binding [Sphingomonas guangdongensis]
MKGIIFNLLEEVVTDTADACAWDNLLDTAAVTGAYTSLGSYPDAELVALLSVFSAQRGTDLSDTLRWFGRSAMPVLARRYPAFFTAANSARDFVLSVNSIIHPEVRKLYAGAGCPHFHFSSGAAGELLVGYGSARQLCWLGHGFIEGASDHFAEPVRIEHRQCMHRGDKSCVLALDWSQQ